MSINEFLNIIYWRYNYFFPLAYKFARAMKIILTEECYFTNTHEYTIQTMDHSILVSSFT